VSKFKLAETPFEGKISDKIACNPTWSAKMTVLSKFLEFLLNLLSNNLKIATKFVSQRCQSLNYQKYNLK